MSITLGRVTYFPVYESPALPKAADDGVASCSSSSIGRNSDCDGGSDDGDEAEVQSSYKGPLDTMDALQDSLPFRSRLCTLECRGRQHSELSDFRRRGISKFYCGKSKSFTSLADALPSSSAKDLAKPENCYNRKRKDRLSFNLWEKPSQNSHISNGDIAISKRPANSSRSTLGLGPSTSSSSGSNGSSEEYRSQSQKLPPLHPQGQAIAQICSSAPTNRFSFPTRSFSLADLEGCVGVRGSCQV